MKFLGLALIALMSWTRLVKAQQFSIANLTSCGLECLIETIPQANCTLADAKCQCSSPTLPQLSSACLLANCTMHDSLVVAKVTASLCDYPHPDRSNVPIIVAAAVLTVTSIFILLRLASKQWVSGGLEWEDWIITFALLLSVVTTYFTVTFCHEGFGKHLWDLNDGDLSRILEHFYIGESVYVVDLALSKISILVFYLRIFPHNRFRYAAFATIAMISINTVIIFLMTVFSCHPVAYFWDRDLKGKCIDVNALAYANSGTSIAQDLIIVALPIPIVVKLNMSTRKKIGVGFMFAVGSLGCIISMIRLKALLSFGNSIDPSWDYVDAVTWTSLELAIAMICACLPAIRNLFIRLYPRVFLTSMRSSTTGKNSSPGEGRHRWSKNPIPGHSDGDSVELRVRDGGSIGARSDIPLKAPPNELSSSSLQVADEVLVETGLRRESASNV